MVQPPPGSPPTFAPPPQPPSWGSPGWSVQRSSGTSLGILVGVVVLVLVFVLVLPALFMAGVGSSSSFIFAPFCAIFVAMFIGILVVIVAAASQGANRSRLPPPPPIQQPMVPAGMQGPVALSCPNCGAPPSNVDRFGVATCPYCSTRFLVR